MKSVGENFKKIKVNYYQQSLYTKLYFLLEAYENASYALPSFKISL